MSVKAHQRETPVGYVLRFSQAAIDRYLDVLRTEDPQAAALIAQRYAADGVAVDADADENDRRAAKTAQIAAYRDLWQRLSAAEQLTLASHDAKINHFARVARIMATSEVVQAHNALKANTAGSIDYVIRRCRENNVKAADLQVYIDQNAKAWFSLTGHPTNPTTVEYTVAQTQVARMIAEPAASKADLRAALLALARAPVVGAHKTPLEEAEETLNALDVVFEAAVPHKKLFEAALEKHGYAAEGVKIRRPLVAPCAWTLGDGDGNGSMTAEVLETGIALHRARIRARYTAYLTSLAATARKEGLAVEKISGLTPDEAGARAAVALAQQFPRTKTARGLQNFAYLYGCFGAGFGKIDLRHNALDIMEAAAVTAAAGGVMPRADFEALDMAARAEAISGWLKDTAVMEKLAAARPDDVLTARIMGRLRVIAANPDMCEKLIVAETAQPAHVLAALLLLKASGNAAGTEDSRVDLVVLSESVADLQALGALVETLLSDATFRAHVAARGRLVVMIAKSDTTRQDGRGEAEYAQYEAVSDVFRAAMEMQAEYPELKDMLVSIKNGGGHALQRGGGRVTEVPAVHGWAAQAAGAQDMGPSTLTIQGQQQVILFCPGRTALGTLEALAAQNLYTKVGIHGAVPSLSQKKNVNRKQAQEDATLYAAAAGAAFDALAKGNPAVDELLEGAPWLSMKAGNVSSRPAARGAKPVGPGVTPREAKGKKPKALSGRAISGERLTAHACLPVFVVLGLAEAMEAVRLKSRGGGDGVDPLHHLYRAKKIHRDAARATLNAAAMADFDIAWPLLAGCARPARMEVRRMAKLFSLAPNARVNTKAVTLAFLEEYFLKVEKMTFEMVSGQRARAGMRHGDALAKLWPDLALQVEARNAAAVFARSMQALRTRAFDAEPDVPLSEVAFRITQALYTGADVVNAPTGILATRTRLEPVYEIGSTGRTRFMRPQSYMESDVAHLLDIPAVLDV